MRKFLFIIVLSTSFSAFSQRDVNYNFTVNFTLTHNENFGEYDYYLDETDKSFFAYKSILLRNGFDVKLNNFVSIGINLGFDWHPDQDILAIPYYLDSKFTLAQVDDDKFYIETGIGRLLKIGKAFERGNYYKVGIGYHISTESSYSFVLNLDFHQKKIANFENGRLNSLSFGFGIFFL